MDDPHNGDAIGTPEARLGSELRRLRVQAGLSVRALASKLHRSHSGIVEYEHGRRLAPVDVVEQYEQFFGLARGTLGAQRERARLERLEDPRDGTLDEHLGSVTCPYMGLRAFGHDDAPLFFGRETQVEQVLTRLRESRFMAVIGASGSGKSSFVQAGLVAGLGSVSDGDGNARPAVLTPGAHPVAALADAVGGAIGDVPRVPADALMADPGLLYRALRRARRGTAVLAVDQFEELFTTCEDEDERRAFVDALIGAWRDPASPVVVIVALRSDLYGRVATYPQLSAAVVSHQTLLGPMRPDELRRAIEQPAARTGLGLQPGLVETILDDLVDQPAALPLLSHALLETWKRRRRLTLTVAGYHEAGAVRGAIAQTAERTLQSFEEPERVVARRILLRLTDLREGADPVSRRVDRKELSWSGEHPERLERVLGILADERLISVDAGTVAVAHEALIRYWPRLRGWIEADRAALLTHRSLTVAAREWDNLGGDPGALYRGARLATALEWVRDHADDLSDRERVFLDTSRAAEEHDLETSKRRTRRLRALAVALAALTFIVAAVSVVAIDQRDEARRQAGEATSLALVSSALPLVDSRPDVALLLAFEAYRASPRAEAQNAVRRALTAAREPGTLATLRRHAGTVLSVAFAPDRRTLASAGGDNTIRLWSVRARRPITALMTGHTAPVTSVAFSHSGRTLASGSADNTVRLWNVRTRAPLAVLRSRHTAPVTSVAFSPDGRLLASASHDNTIRLWDVRTHKPLGAPLTGHQGIVRSVAFSPDGRRLASASTDKTIRLWDTRTRKRVGPPLIGHRNAVASVAFSPGGDTLASAASDRTIRLWDARTRTPLGAPLTGHVGGVTSVSFSADGHTLASASTDKTVRLWDARARKPLGSPLSGHTAAVSNVAFSGDGRTLASAGYDTTVRLWDARARARLRGPLAGHTAPIQSVAFGRDPRVLASGSDDGTILLWDAQQRRPLGPPLIGHTESVESVAFDRRGRTLASGASDRTVRLWDTQRRRQLGGPLTGHTAAVTSVTFSPDGRVLASSGFDDAVRLWDTRRHEQLRPPLVGHTAAVSGVAFSPDGHTLASAGFDKAVRLWDVRRHKQLEPPLIGHSAPVSSVAFSPGGRILASGSFDGTVRLWDATRYKALGAPLTGHTNAVRLLAFSPDGRTLASASSDNTIRLWDARTRKPVGAPLTGHDDWVTSVAFSRDGRLLASGSNDRTVRLWHANVPKPLNAAAGGIPGRASTFSRHSRVLPAARIDAARRLQTALNWRSVSELRAIVCNIVGSGLSRVDWTRHAFGIPYRQSCP